MIVHRAVLQNDDGEQNLDNVLRCSLAKLVRLMPWIALGPFTGFLGWRMEYMIQARQWVLAGLYGLAIITTSAALVLLAKSLS